MIVYMTPKTQKIINVAREICKYKITMEDKISSELLILHNVFKAKHMLFCHVNNSGINKWTQYIY